MEKINKTKAKKLFEQGETILVIPHKINPNNIWNIGLTIQQDLIANSINNQTFGVQGFDFVVDRYTIYNCNFECGYYCAYYLIEHKAD